MCQDGDNVSEEWTPDTDHSSHEYCCHVLKTNCKVLVFKNPLEVTIFLGKPLVFLRSFKILVHTTNPWSEGREPGRPENKRW